MWVILLLLKVIDLIDKKWIANEKFYININENYKDIILKAIFFILIIITIISSSFIMKIKIQAYINIVISNLLTVFLVTISIYVCSKFREIPGLPEVNSIWGKYSQSSGVY